MKKGVPVTLKSARTNADLTQVEAAKALSKYLGQKVERGSIGHYEQDPSRIPYRWAMGLSKIYKMPVEQFILEPGSLTKRHKK